MSSEQRFAALRFREFRLVWFGQFATTLGKRMQTAIILWHIYELTGDELALGAVGLVNFLPIVFISLLSGVLADVMNRRVLMLWTQLSMVVLTALLAWTTFRGFDSVWMVYTLSLLSTAGWTFETPARQALIPSLVPRSYLSNAYSLMSAVLQLGSILGPAIGGLALARFSVGAAYAINALPFLVAAAALIVMRSSGFVEGNGAEATEEKPTLSVRAVREGLRFVFGHPIIRPLMLLDFFATFFSSAVVLLPVFAIDILQVGAQGYGWLYAAVSVGSMVTAAALSMRRRLSNQGQLLLWAVAIYGLATIMFGLSRSFMLSFLALALTGAADTLSTILRHTIRNLQTPDRMRGRMTSMNMIFFRGGPELGELEAGVLASAFGAPFAVVSGGLGCLLALFVISWKSPMLRQLQEGEPSPTPAM